MKKVINKPLHPVKFMASLAVDTSEAIKPLINNEDKMEKFKVLKVYHFSGRVMLGQGEYVGTFHVSDLGVDQRDLVDGKEIELKGEWITKQEVKK